jgi:predicted signal transduction protein with EAL and GGDEF domain
MSIWTVFSASIQFGYGPVMSCCAKWQSGCWRVPNPTAGCAPGGDAFGILVPGVCERTAAEVFARWLLRAFELPFALDRIELFLSVSVGVAWLSEGDSDVFSLLTDAETAMSAVKHKGGNGFLFLNRTC